MPYFLTSGGKRLGLFEVASLPNAGYCKCKLYNTYFSLLIFWPLLNTQASSADLIDICRCRAEREGDR